MAAAFEIQYLVRFSQAHESFRVPELQALADLEKIDMKVVEYSPDVSLASLMRYALK